MNNEALARRKEIDDLLSGTFNSILRVEERALENRLTRGLTITEMHTIEAVGYREQNPMTVIAARLGVTLATLTIAINRLVDKGFVERVRDEADRRRVLVSLTKRGRQVYRAHSLFHKHLIEEALSGLSAEEETVLCNSLEKVKSFFDRQAQSE